MSPNDNKLDPGQIGPNTPLRLHRAAEIAFPDGSMSIKGLRREAQRGRLVIERIAGKDYTTLSAIEDMRKLCRLGSNRHGSGSGQAVATNVQRGSSFMSDGNTALAALKAILEAPDRISAQKKNRAPR